MERRALIAVVISILILVLYQELVMKRFSGPSAAPPAGEQGAAPEANAPPPNQPPANAPPPPAAAPAAVAAAGTDVTVETNLYRAVFTTAGARLRSLELKRYRTTVDPNSPPL